jgi:energy-coupling factor transporter ATP-binding protein EcfA2
MLWFDTLTPQETALNTSNLRSDGTLQLQMTSENVGTTKLKTEIHAIVDTDMPEYPVDFDPNIRAILDKPTFTVKELSECADEELLEIKGVIKPAGGKLNFDDCLKIKREKWARLKIPLKKVEAARAEQYQGFNKSNDPTITGKCISIPAIKEPEGEFSGNKSTFHKLIQDLVEGLDLTDGKRTIVTRFKDLQEELINLRQDTLSEFAEKMNNELLEWDTTVMIEMEAVQLSEAIPTKASISFDDGIRTGIGYKGTGFQRYAFFKLLKVFMEYQKSSAISVFFLFEEPEAHLHPQMQQEVAEVIKRLSESSATNFQVFLATHSPHFIDMINIDRVFVFSKGVDYCSSIKEYDFSTQDLKEQVKITLNFNSHVREIFFANHITLVEGECEEICYGYMQSKGTLNVKNTVINARSKDNIPFFQKILNHLNVPYTILMDEEPFFKEHGYNKSNPKSVQERRRKYHLNVDIIAEASNGQNQGHVIIISPDFDNLIKISKNSDNKPKQTLERIEECFSTTGDKILAEKIVKIFRWASGSVPMPFQAVDQDGNEWVDPLVKTEPTPTYPELKNNITQIGKTWRNQLNSITDPQKLELASILFPQKTQHTKSKSGSASSLDKFA